MFNYDNIGGKIKSLAKVAFIVEAIAAVISGLVMFAEDDDMFLIALLVAIVGPIVAWVGSWLLYGFGQLVENSDTLVKNTTKE